MLPAFSTVPLGEDAKAALAEVPALAGVAEIVGPGARSLMIGRGADMRRWAASHLGMGKPPARGVRPPVDLRPIAAEIRWAATTTGFQQRLVYERLMAQHVPLAKRRDLKVPGYLALDQEARFPRLEVVADPQAKGAHGPFRDKAAAQRALAALHRELPMRPCDYTFEPHAELALGLSCLYAQVRSCAAPCLERCTEDDYRALADKAAALLRGAEGRPPEVAETLPPWVAPVAGLRALVVEPVGEQLEVYPVHDGNVLDAQAAAVDPAALEDLMRSVTWTGAAAFGSDLPWLSSWLATPRRSGRYVVTDGLPSLAAAAAVRQHLAVPAA